MRRVFSILVASALLLSFGFVMATPVAAATLTVDTSQPNVPPNYHTIQAAIDDASPGDTIEVAAGTYEEAITIDKSLNLIGAQANVVPVAGGRPGGESVLKSQYLLTIWANDVNINGFEITDFRYGINTQTADDETREDISILYNYIHSDKAWVGVLFGERAPGSSGTGDALFRSLVVANNHIDVNADEGGDPYTLSAVSFTSGFDTISFEDVVISNNEITNPTRYGIFCGAATDKYSFVNPVVSGNIIRDCLTGINAGNMYNASITGNAFDGNRYAGAQIGILGGTVADNTFDNTGPSPYWPYAGLYYPSYGLMFWGTQWGFPVGSHDVEVLRNCFYFNNFTPERENAARVLPGCDANTIVFRENTFSDMGAETDAIALVNEADAALVATHNWWGHASGPYHDPTNVGGQGGQVSDAVDFVPWLTGLAYTGGTAFTEADNVVLQATLSSSDNGAPGAMVDFYVDGNHVGSADADLSGVAELEIGTLTAGSYVATARAAGCFETTAELEVEAAPQPTPPTAGIAYPFWTVILAGLIAGAALLALRRRQTQSQTSHTS